MSTRDEFLLIFVRIFAHFTSVGVHVCSEKHTVWWSKRAKTCGKRKTRETQFSYGTSPIGKLQIAFENHRFENRNFDFSMILMLF